MNQSRPAAIKLMLVVAVGLFTFVTDQFTKWMVIETLSPGEPVNLLGSVVQLNLFYNPDLAFGISFRGAPYLILLALLILVFITVSIIRSRSGTGEGAKSALPPSLLIAIGLGLGAATGNLLDRLRFGAVVDFIDLGFWPVFNVADIALTAAAVLLAFHLLIGGKR